MAIKVGGVVVLDNSKNLNVGILTATSLDVPPEPISFSPSDASSDNSIDTNIVITYNTDVQKGSGNITLKEGNPSTGTVIQTIAVSSGTVSISAGVVTINPASDLPTGKDIYVVIDDGAFESVALGSGTNELNTYNFTTGPITTSSFSPSDGATDQSVSTNIVITFSENITKETTSSQKYIRIRSGNASGTVLQTIDVASSAVSVSGSQATINPPSDLAYETDQYIVVDENSFFNSDGDANSGNDVINTYNFTTETDVPPLGQAYGGGTLVCCSGGTLFVIAPTATEVETGWWQRNQAVTCANAQAACGDWFVPTMAQWANPGWQCRTHWWTSAHRGYWSNNDPSGSSFPTTCSNHPPMCACYAALSPTEIACYGNRHKSTNTFGRAFRCVSY